ncbi:MAG: hypothetical protein IPJ41_07160 [Phycisphaerales bacterium]|nr:hypothetical protein [Phycisphaerales bacterium]
MRPIGIVGSGGDIVIPYRAINERGVQVYQSAGLWLDGTYSEMPQPVGDDGEYQDVVSYQFRPSPAGRPGRAQTIPRY